MSPPGVTTVVGHSPIPFAGLGAYGDPRRWQRGRGRQSPGFAGSADLTTIAQEALLRYQNAIDVANQECEGQSGLFQKAFNWATGNTSTQSICAAAQQMQINYDGYLSKIQDSYTSDDQIAEIVGFIGKEIDISDLIATAKATNAVSVAGRALLDAPGTAVGMATGAAGQVGAGIIGNIPWWVWVGGAVFLATQLGWEPWKSKPLKR